VAAFLGEAMKVVVFLLSTILLACATGSTVYSAVPPQTQALLGQSPASLDSQDTSATSTPASLAAAPSMEELKLKADFQLKLTLLVSIFGIIGLIFVAWLFRSSVTADTEKIVRLVIVVIVVTASLILIAGGYSTNQTAPAFGLFGSIIGYILGSANRQTPGNTPADGGTSVTGNTPPSGSPITPAVNKT
jgi:quinol-cytochrome oxidoreductase complex cytochrome b subunit